MGLLTRFPRRSIEEEILYERSIFQLRTAGTPLQF